MPSQLELIASAIAMSETLLTLAEQQDWQQFSQINQQRQTVLTQLDLQSVQTTPDQHQQLQQKMSSLITLNSQIEAICRQQRDEIADSIKQLNKGKTAKNAYSK